MNYAAGPDCPAPALHPLLHTWRWIAARWRGHLDRMRCEREMDAMSELSRETLREIGAPNGWIESAALRREREKIHLLELRQWRNG